MRTISCLFIFGIILPIIVFADTTFFDNQNDVFILGNTQTQITPADSNIISGTTGDCSYKWNCTNWSECFLYGKQTRTCNNIGTCSDKYKTPQKEQNCTYINQKKDEKLKKENIIKEIPETEEKENAKNELIIVGKINKSKVYIYSIILLVVLIIIYNLKKIIK